MIVSKSQALLRKYPITFHLGIIGFVWLIMQAFFIFHFGIVTNHEAEKYLFEANHLLATGAYSSSNFLFYSTEILLIAFCMKLHVGFWFIVLIQILMNGISVLCFYKMVKRFSYARWLPLIATLYFLLLFYYHLYNTFLYTESLFFSLSVIYTYVLFTRENLHAKNILLIIFFLVLLYFTRPTGIFFLPATYLFLVFRFYRQHSKRILLISGVLALTILSFLLNYSLGSGGELDFLLPYSREMILCGVPTVNVPHDLSVPVETNSIQGIFFIITHHFDLFAKLAFKRLAAFFGIYRPFYSLFHNIFACVYFFLCYFFIIYNLPVLFKKHKAECWFLLSCILLMTITIMLTCDEWSNRFVLSILPFLLLLAVIGITNRTQFIRDKSLKD